MNNDISEEEICDCPSIEIILDSISRIINNIMKNLSQEFPYYGTSRCWLNERPPSVYIRKFLNYFYCFFPRKDGDYAFFYFEWIVSRRRALNLQGGRNKLCRSLNLFLMRAETNSRDIGETIQQKLDFVSHNGKSEVFKIFVDYNDDECYFRSSDTGNLTKGCR